MTAKITIEREDIGVCDCDCPECNQYKFSWKFDEEGVVEKPKRATQKALASLYEEQEYIKSERILQKQLDSAIESHLTYVYLICIKCGYKLECFIDSPYNQFYWGYQFHCNFPMMIEKVTHIAGKFIGSELYNERIEDETTFEIKEIKSSGQK